MIGYRRDVELYWIRRLRRVKLSELAGKRRLRFTVVGPALARGERRLANQTQTEARSSGGAIRRGEHRPFQPSSRSRPAELGLAYRGTDLGLRGRRQLGYGRLSLEVKNSSYKIRGI
jgi:hypothetical protein